MFGVFSADLAGVLAAEQILGLVVLVALVVWLTRRAVKRSHSRYEQLAPQPVTVGAIVADAQAAPASNGAAPEPIAEPKAEPETSELEAELREIYVKVGQPDAFEEAKGKVIDLASDLVERDGIEMDEALPIAYRRSLAEHRSYLAEHGLA